MKSKVFVSCGQRTDEEIRIAGEIGKMLADRGFEPYLAKEVQTIFDVAEIIRELKDSDFYLFINFCRESLGETGFRGSLFSNQEFSIAYALGFQKILVVNQRGILREGLLAYFVCNTDDFNSYDGCLPAVQKALDRSSWQPGYSRRLWAGELRLSDEVIRYRDLTGHFLYLDIHNSRPDIAALEASGRLVSYGAVGAESKTPSNIRSLLKATAKPAFSHTIFPNSHEAFDLLCVGESSHAPAAQRIYLNSALDVIPTPALPITNGEWELHYEFYAIDFPRLAVVIRLVWPCIGNPSARLVRQDVL